MGGCLGIAWYGACWGLVATAASMDFSLSLIPGSGLPRWAHSHSLCDVAKLSLHHLVDL